MEDQDKKIVELKAELYDSGKELFKLNSIVNTIAQKLKVSTLEELMAAIDKLAPVDSE